MSRRDKRATNDLDSTQEIRGNRVNYYAHTAGDGEGRQLPEQHWQPLADHLRNVADQAKQFAAPLGLSAEAELEHFQQSCSVLGV